MNSENSGTMEPEYKKLNIFKTKFGQMLEKFLHDYCPDTLLLDDLVTVKSKTVEYKEKYILVKGNLQSGKTKFIIGSAMKQLMFKKSSIVLFRNITNDHVQTKKRFESCIQEFINLAEKQGVCKSDIVNSIKILDDLSEESDIDNIVTANPPGICILIANETKMKKITDRLAEFQETDIKYTLFIDEVDHVDSTTAEEHKKYTKMLKDDASLVVGVSATILGTFAEWNLKPNCVRELAVPENYVGIKDLKPIFKNTGHMQIKKNSTITEIFKKIPCLKEYLDEIASGSLSNTLCFENQAMIDLICVSRFISPQKRVFDYMVENFPSVASVIMVENGIGVYHPCLGEKNIKLGENKSKCVKGIHYFSSKNDIGSILGLLETKTVKCIKSIVIFAGCKANRAITFSSSGIEYKNEKEKMRRWHLKRALIRFSKDPVTQDEAMQRAGRLCGIFEHSSTQILCANLRDLEIIKKAYHVQEDILENTVRKNKNIQNSESGKDLINNLELSSWKTNASGHTTTGRKKNFRILITNRKSFSPKMVEDDGRHTEKDFDFNEKTLVPEKEAGQEIAITKDEILRILNIFPGLSAAEIFEKSKNWSFINAIDPKSAVSNAVKDMTRSGILSRTGHPYKYTVI